MMVPLFLPSAQEIDRYWHISGEGIAQKSQHALTSGLVLVVAQLKTEPFARLTVELNDRFNVQKVIRGAETGTQVVDPETGDPPLRLQEGGRAEALLEIASGASAAARRARTCALHCATCCGGPTSAQSARSWLRFACSVSATARRSLTICWNRLQSGIRYPPLHSFQMIELHPKCNRIRGDQAS